MHDYLEKILCEKKDACYYLLHSLYYFTLYWLVRGARTENSRADQKSFEPAAFMQLDKLFQLNSSF